MLPVVALAWEAACSSGSNGDGVGGAGAVTSADAVSTSDASASASVSGSSGSAMTETLDDAQIADAIFTANDGEVQEAEAVLPRLEDASALAFAKDMITEHEAASDELAQILASEDIERESSDVSAMLAANAQADIKKLAKKPDGAVDAAYMDAQVAEHETLLDVIDDLLVIQVKDERLKNFLFTMRGDVQMHVMRAEQIRRAMPPD